MASLVQDISPGREAAAVSAPVVVGVVRGVDLILFLAAGLIAAGSADAWREASLRGPLALAALVGATAGAAALSSRRVYAFDRLRAPSDQLIAILKAVILAGAASIVCLFLAGPQLSAARMFPLIFVAAALALFAVFRTALAGLIARWSQAGRLRRRIAVVAVSEFSREFIERLRAEPESFEIVGVYDDRLNSGRVPPVHAGIAVRGSVADLVRDSRSERVDVIAVALPLGATQRISDVLDELSSTVADLCLTTDLAGLNYRGGQFGVVGSNPIIAVGETPMKDWRAAKKRCFDYVVGALALVLLSPPLAALALAVKLDSRGPVLFRQPRLGFNNRMFVCYKFRTMYVDMTDVMADRQTTRDDPRVTRVGKWLRKLSLDELPQLFNVMNGTMSLVGPRPHAPNTKAADRLFAEVVQKYALRHRVKPGITGWAQVNGWRGETTTVEQVENRVRCDLFYIDHWSLLFDLRIALLTVLREINSRHAY